MRARLILLTAVLALAMPAVAEAPSHVQLINHFAARMESGNTVAYFLDQAEELAVCRPVEDEQFEDCGTAIYHVFRIPGDVRQGPSIEHTPASLRERASR